MKNRWALRLAALTLVSCLAMSGVSLAVEPGSATDPLVTLSYLNDVFLGQIMTKVDQRLPPGTVSSFSSPGARAECPAWNLPW